MKRDVDKKRIYRLKVNDEGRRILQAAILNRLILDGTPISVNSSPTDPDAGDTAIIDGNCIVKICDEWIKSIGSTISNDDTSDEISF